MNKISSVAVFCGSRTGTDPAFAASVRDLGHGLATLGLRLVYGGGNNGLMGILANATLAAGGRVLGVIPDFLTKWEVAHEGLTEMRVTGSMHDRKRVMAEEADAFVMMPGGIGTFDETIEILAWRQLRLHARPVFICRVGGWADPFLALVDSAIAQGFAATAVRDMFTVVDDVPALLAHLGRDAAGGPPAAPSRL